MNGPLQPVVLVPVDTAPTLDGPTVDCEVCRRPCWRDLEAETTGLGLARMAGGTMVRVCDLCYRLGALEADAT